MLYKNTIGSGENLVLLHGWGFSSALFNQLIERYQRQYCISVIDLPGHGRSDNINGGLAKWSAAIIEILPKNPILLGWSLGGLLAIYIASKIPLAKLVLVATTPKFVQDDDWAFGIDANNFKQFSETLNLNLPKGLKRFVSLQCEDKSRLKNLNQLIKQYPASGQALNQGLEILLNTNLIATFTKLKLPIEVVLGKRDTLVPNIIAKWYAQCGVRVLVLDTGHLPFLDKNFKLT